MCETAGHVINASKSKVWSPTAASLDRKAIRDLASHDDNDGNATDGVKIVPADRGMRVLGAPIGSTQFVQDWLDKKADQTELLVKEILAIATTDDDDSVSAQAALHLLRHTAVPRASFLLRCLPPLQTLDFAERHDDAVMRTFSALLGADDPLGADSAA